MDSVLIVLATIVAGLIGYGFGLSVLHALRHRDQFGVSIHHGGYTK